MSSTLDLNSMLRCRAAMLRVLRSNLDASGALEVRTSVLSEFPDLAPVPQFTTLNPRSKQTFCLRIAPEESLTRLIANGAIAVYEISNNFRIEDEDPTHLCEFDSVEAMFVDFTYESLVPIINKICKDVGEAVANELSLDAPWFSNAKEIPVVNLCSWVEKELGIEAQSLLDINSVMSILEKLGQRIDADTQLDTAVDKVIEAIAGNFHQAVFIGCVPNFLGGPANRHPDYPEFSEWYEFYYGGLELGAVANQLTNAKEWKTRYEQNYQKKKSTGVSPNKKNQSLLKNLTAFSTPYAGLGLGIDRILMLATGAHSIDMIKS